MVDRAQVRDYAQEPWHRTPPCLSVLGERGGKQVLRLGHGRHTTYPEMIGIVPWPFLFTPAMLSMKARVLWNFFTWIIQCHKWDISMVFVPDAVTKAFLEFRTVLVFSDSSSPVFYTACLVFTVQYKEAALVSCEITHNPTLMRIHTLPPGIPEEMYSISQEHDCLVPCPQFHTNTSAPLSNMGDV